MTTTRVELAGSHHEAPASMHLIGRVPEDEPITVSIYVKAKGDAGQGGTSRSSMQARRKADHAGDMDAVAAFAGDHGLAVVEVDPARCLIQVRGPAQALEQAFGTQLHHYEATSGAVYRGRAGGLHVPQELGERVLAVLGLDTTPIATPKIVPHRGVPPKGFLPTEVGALYGFAGAKATGQCIAIVELGGGYSAKDNTAAFKAMGLPVPKIVSVAVDGAGNDPSDGSGANGEVALDIQVAGGLAPGARLAVYFAPNTSQGFADAISQAVHDRTNTPSVISISWGSAESGWSGQAIAAMHQAFADAATLGITVFAASGDSLATDGVTDGKAHVDYPASDPLVIGCGGTKLTESAGAIAAETVWNSNGGGTGGGVSALFPKPSYQAHAKTPKAPTGKGGRGVPDVAGNADPDSGYRVAVDGKTEIVGGTSAVAPLWAGIAAVLNAGRAKPLGDAHAQLYGAATAFRDIVQGDNRSGTIGFAATPGWDPCTGLGSPIGAALRKAFGS